MKTMSSLLLVATLVAAGCATQPAVGEVPAIADAVSPAPGVVSAGRLAPADIERVRDADIRHVIDLTPDAETPDFDEAAAARAGGLDYSNLPLSGPADLTRENVHAFDAMLRYAKRPVLGQRNTMFPSGLHARCRNRPDGVLEVDFAPLSSADFATSRGR